MTPLEGLLHQVAREARVAANCAMPGWAYAVVLSGRDILDKLQQIKPIRSYPTRAAMPSEIVRIDLNFLDQIADLAACKLLLRMEIEPYIIGVGQIRAVETAEGLVIIACDERKEIGLIEHSACSFSEASQ